MPVLAFHGWGGDAERLASKAHLFLALSELTAAAAMTPIDEPSAIYWTADDERDSGPSASQMMAESHVALHAFPGAGYLMGTVASCKPFPEGEGALLAVVRERFGLTKMHSEMSAIGTLPSLQGEPERRGRWRSERR